MFPIHESSFLQSPITFSLAKLSAPKVFKDKLLNIVVVMLEIMGPLQKQQQQQHSVV